MSIGKAGGVRAEGRPRFDGRTRLRSGQSPAFAWMHQATCVAQVLRGGMVGLPGGGRERGESQPLGQLLLMEG